MSEFDPNGLAEKYPNHRVYSLKKMDSGESLTHAVVNRIVADLQSVQFVRLRGLQQAVMAVMRMYQEVKALSYDVTYSCVNINSKVNVKNGRPTMCGVVDISSNNNVIFEGLSGYQASCIPELNVENIPIPNIQTRIHDLRKFYRNIQALEASMLLDNHDKITIYSYMRPAKSSQAYKAFKRLCDKGNIEVIDPAEPKEPGTGQGAKKGRGKPNQKTGNSKSPEENVPPLNLNIQEITKDQSAGLSQRTVEGDPVSLRVDEGERLLQIRANSETMESPKSTTQELTASQGVPSIHPITHIGEALQKNDKKEKTEYTLNQNTPVAPASAPQADVSVASKTQGIGIVK